MGCGEPFPSVTCPRLAQRQWRAEIEAWLVPALAEAGVTSPARSCRSVCASCRRYCASRRKPADHSDAVLASGVPHFPEAPADVVRWVTDRVDALRAPPAKDPRRPTDEESALVDEDLGRIHDGPAALAVSGLPSL